MSKILVTGSTQGIGLQTARDLLAQGHEVVLHARTAEKADASRSQVGGSEVLVGDLGSLDQTRELARAARDAGPFDVVIHNAGLGGSSERVVTGDGLSEIFQVNVVAPYLLTALLPAPARLVYLTSGLESAGRVDLGDLQWESRPWDGMQAYSDSKLYDVVLALWVSRQWPQVLANAVDPGWIKTRMGGAGATDDLPDGAETQVWLATSDDPEAKVTGRYFKRRQDLEANPAAYDEELQQALVDELVRITGVEVPGGEPRRTVD